ncbi:MAG: hypothetical protein JHD35_09675 [Sphingopyxis sp.]|nr:hypothetical protein [Sphingopyxis sp.]
MPADFSKQTIDTLAKRAAYLCSGPDCRVSTVGPNSEAARATIIGEAAHVYAARAGEARYDESMNDQARAAISNAIWLCRNCHRQVDRDAQKFPADLLFLWREQHEEYVASNLGSKSDKARFDLARHELAQFEGYPPLIRRIACDKPPGWEWSLSAALMRHLNAPLFRRLADLREGVCALTVYALDNEAVIDFAHTRLEDMTEIIGPLGKILERFNRAWGAPGEPGDINEIHHTALLLRDSLAQIVAHEEMLRSVRVSPKHGEVINLLQDALGSQAEKFAATPDRLDEIVDMAIRLDENGSDSTPIVVTETITFELPDGWADKFNRAVRRIEGRGISKGFAEGYRQSGNSGSGCLTAIGFMIFFLLLLQFF